MLKELRGERRKTDVAGEEVAAVVVLLFVT